MLYLTNLTIVHYSISYYTLHYTTMLNGMIYLIWLVDNCWNIESFFPFLFLSFLLLFMASWHHHHLLLLSFFLENGNQFPLIYIYCQCYEWGVYDNIHERKRISLCMCQPVPKNWFVDPTHSYLSGNYYILFGSLLSLVCAFYRWIFFSLIWDSLAKRNIAFFCCLFG